MTFCLDAKIIKPVGENINNVVILLHGYGGDGNDIAALTINWKRFLPTTLFKGGDTSKKYSNKLMQLRVLLQFVAIIVLVCLAYFFKD